MLVPGSETWSGLNSQNEGFGQFAEGSNQICLRYVQSVQMTKTTVDQSQRRSDSRHEHCPFPSGILAETDRPHGDAVPCRRDICGRSASEQQTFSDTSCR